MKEASTPPGRTDTWSLFPAGDAKTIRERFVLPSRKSTHRNSLAIARIRFSWSSSTFFKDIQLLPRPSPWEKYRIFAELLVGFAHLMRRKRRAA